MGRSLPTPLRVARLALISAVAKGPGFLIPLAVAAFFGAGPITDAYFLAYGALLLAGGSVGPPLQSAIVPFVAERLRGDRALARAYVRGASRLALAWGLVAGLAGGIIIGVGLIVARPAGVEPREVLALYALLSPAVLAWALAGIFNGALVASWKLETSAIGNAFRGIGALAGAVCGASIGSLWPVAVGLSLAEWTRVWWLKKQWARLVTADGEADRSVSRDGFGAAALHQICAQSLTSAAPLAERFIVGTVAVAAISHVEYAYRLVAVAAVLFDSGIAPWLLAKWASLRAQGMLVCGWKLVFRPILIAGGLAASMGAALSLGAPIIVRLLLQHGAFTASDAGVVTPVLQWYGVGFTLNMSALCIERLLLARAQNRLFLQLGVVRTVVRVGVVATLVGRLSLLAVPAGFMVAEGLYVLLLLLSAISPAERILARAQ